MKYENIQTSVHDAVAVVTLDRPKVLNALNHDMMAELADAIDGFEADGAIGVIVLTGNEKAFAAGADRRWWKRPPSTCTCRIISPQTGSGYRNAAFPSSLPSPGMRWAAVASLP